MYKFWKSVSFETFIETLKKKQTFMEKEKKNVTELVSQKVPS